jgi:Xaa-Pro aminopeptidase
MKSLEKTFELKKIKLVKDHDLIEEIWEDRPEVPLNELFIQPVQFAGKSRVEKIKEIRRKMKDKLADVHLICTLDDIAWTFNIRGNDVDFNPVVVAYALIDAENANLYIKDSKIPENARKELEADGITLKDRKYRKYSCRSFKMQCMAL